MMQIPVRFVRVEEYRPWEDDYLLNFGFVRRINSHAAELKEESNPRSGLN
jgi:hypothetical protein